MARHTRFRSRTITFPSGKYTPYIDNVAQAPVVSPARNNLASCGDSIGSPVVDSALTLTSFTRDYPKLNGRVESTYIGKETHTVYEGYTTSSLPAPLTNMVVIPAPSGWLLDVVAGTNPSRPVIGIPIWAQNLAQLPKMVKNLGDLIRNPGNVLKPKGFAGEYLGVQFGWLPLIDDLTKLLDFQSHVLKRNKELAQLYSGKGLRRRLKLADDTSSTGVNTNLGFYPTGTITMTASVTVKRRQWGTIHWYPTTIPVYHPDDHKWHNLTNRIVLGATPEGLAKGLWDVIPWTWLLGWFTNLGKYTLAHSWTVPANHTGGCLMSEAIGTWKAGSATVSGGSGSVTYSGSVTRSLKTRIVSSVVTVGVNMPYIDMFRLSILGALFVQRFPLGK